jgi:hypothetical protein
MMRGPAWLLAAMCAAGTVFSQEAAPTASPASTNQKPSVSATIDDAAATTHPNELKETQDRLHAFEQENEALRRRNDLSNNTIRTLSESLAVANAECEVFRRQYSELKLRMEAFGLASVGDNKEALEQRLLTSVRDLALTRDERDKLSEKLAALSESVVLALKTATLPNPQLRLDVEEQLRAANESLTAPANPSAPAEPEPDLMNGKVISVKEEYSLLVANLGSKQGVKIGMPFQIVRDGTHAVGRAKVVDVRDRISGAVIEEYSSNTEKVKVGDELRVDAQQPAM